MRRVLLLPGLDGTGELFAPFVARAPAGLAVEVARLPEPLTEYPALADWALGALRLDPETVLVAESFAGPLAVLIAARTRLAAVVLVNTWIVSPYSQAWHWLIRPWAFRVPPPRRVLRARMLGATASEALVARARQVVASVPPAVMAGRLRAMMRADVRREAAEVARGGTPLVVLHGDGDGLVPRRSVGHVEESVPVKPTVIHLDGPHLLLQVEPEACWRALGPWVGGALAEASARHHKS